MDAKSRDQNHSQLVDPIIFSATSSFSIRIEMNVIHRHLEISSVWFFQSIFVLIRTLTQHQCQRQNAISSFQHRKHNFEWISTVCKINWFRIPVRTFMYITLCGIFGFGYSPTVNSIYCSGEGEAWPMPTDVGCYQASAMYRRIHTSRAVTTYIHHYWCDGVSFPDRSLLLNNLWAQNPAHNCPLHFEMVNL